MLQVQKASLRGDLTLYILEVSKWINVAIFLN